MDYEAILTYLAQRTGYDTIKIRTLNSSNDEKSYLFLFSDVPEKAYTPYLYCRENGKIHLMSFSSKNLKAIVNKIFDMTKHGAEICIRDHVYELKTLIKPYQTLEEILVEADLKNEIV